MRHSQWITRRRVGLALLCALVTAGGLVAGPGAQASQRAPRTAPVSSAWSSGPQIIVNFASNKCLQPKSYLEQALIEQRTCSSSQLQRWVSEDLGNGFVRLVNQGSHFCIDLLANTEAEVGNGTKLEQFDCNIAYTGQQWARSPGSRSAHFQVFNRIKGLCMDVTNRSTSNGAVIQVWSCNFYETAQEFRFTDA
jgi:hypothetical protein